MAYKTRKNLADKVEAAFRAAEAKEGKPITISPVTEDDLIGNVAYRSTTGILLKDGRYVTRFWNDGKRYPLRALDNVPVEVLKVLCESDHDIKLQERYKSENEDYAYQNFLKKEDSEEPNLVNPMDRMAYRTDYGDPAQIVIQRMCPALQPKTNPVGVIGFNGSYYDAPTVRCLKQMASEIIDGFSETEKRDFFIIFCSDSTQKEYAEREHVTPAMISKRKKKLIEKVSQIFRKAGYSPISKDQAKKEAEQRESYEKHYSAVSTQLRKIYNPKPSEKYGYDDLNRFNTLEAVAEIEAG